MMVQVKTGDKAKRSGSSTEDCGTPYESIALSVLRIDAYFSNNRA